MHTTVSAEIDSDVASATGALHTTVSAEIDEDVSSATGALDKVAFAGEVDPLALLTNGTRAMAADLNMGGHSITNIATSSLVYADGVSVRQTYVDAAGDVVRGLLTVSNDLVVVSNLYAAVVSNAVYFGDGAGLTNVTAKAFAETDPAFAASAAALVTGGDTQRWNEAQGWGDHSLVGYVTTGYVDSATGTLHTTVSGEIDSDVASATGALHTTVSAEIDADVGAATGACVQISGDTMTGKLVLPANGLLVGSSQLIVTNGHVGIGTSNPTNALDVNGTIRAKEVFVTADGWPDYVFGKDYALRPLSELEAFIQANGHLPGVPSAGEVASRGVGVGEMQSKLLEKVEELTLHMLNLRRENDDLRRRVVRLEQHRRASPAR